jgi:hypothetical protein
MQLVEQHIMIFLKNRSRLEGGKGRTLNGSSGQDLAQGFDRAIDPGVD